MRNWRWVISPAVFQLYLNLFNDRSYNNLANNDKWALRSLLIYIIQLIPTAATPVIITEKWVIEFYDITFTLKIYAVVSIIEIRVINSVLDFRLLAP